MERGQVSGQGPAALLVELATAGLCGYLFLERVPRSEVGAIWREWWAPWSGVGEPAECRPRGLEQPVACGTVTGPTRNASYPVGARSVGREDV